MASHNVLSKSRPALHLLGLPHTETTRDYSWCAFSMKVLKAATMWTRQGYDVILYSGPHNEAACCEHVVVNDTPAPDQFNPWFDARNPIFRAMNDRAIDAIRERAQPHDLLCLIGGNAQKPIADALAPMMAVEFGIGYAGVFAPYRVFESYAWMHTIYGQTMGAETADGRFYDAVIPNYFDQTEFPKGDGSGDYLLYFGRLTSRKGLEVVQAVTKATGLPLKVAGQRFDEFDCGEYVGVVTSAEERAELMGGARAILVPTLYLEPFGAVAVEAMLTGTPAITTDWGAFTETVEPEWRCRTLAEFVEAVDRAADADRAAIRQRAQDRYSLEAIGPQYSRYFDRLGSLWAGGWYELNSTQLSSRTKVYDAS